MQRTASRSLLQGYLFALGSGIAYGTSTFVIRKAVMDFTTPMMGSAISLFFGILMMAPFVSRDALRTLRAPRRSLVAILAAGACSAIGATALFYATKYSTVVAVAPILSLQSMVALVLTHLFLQRLERVTWRIALGTLLVAGGVALVVVSNA